MLIKTTRMIHGDVSQEEPDFNDFSWPIGISVVPSLVVFSGVSNLRTSQASIVVVVVVHS